MKNIFSTTFFFEEVNPLYKVVNIILISLLVVGIYFIFFNSPPDYQQGNSVRIMYIHVPAAWMSLMLYFLLGFFSVGLIVFKIPMCDIIANSIAPVGLTFSVITLITGSLWGKPMWGAWWVWDVRLTSFSILTFFYFSYISFREFNKNYHSAQNNAALLAVLGLINLPIVKFCVEIWNSLHQPTSLFKRSGPTIDKSMMVPLVIMILFSLFYSLSLALVKIRASIYEKKIAKFLSLSSKH
jgi:heme exporter protein C